MFVVVTVFSVAQDATYGTEMVFCRKLTGPATYTKDALEVIEHAMKCALKEDRVFSNWNYNVACSETMPDDSVEV